MRWRARKQQHGSPWEQEAGGGERARRSRGFFFSPLSWLAKLTTARPRAAAEAMAEDSKKRAPTHENGGGGAAAALALQSCLPERTGPVAPVQSMSAPPRRSPAEVVPRRLSVGNYNSDAVAVAARRHCGLRLRHCSLGGDSDLLLPPLGHLIPFSLAGSTAPSNTHAQARSRRRRHRCRRRHRRSLSGSRRSFSFSGRMPPIRVKLRSPLARRALAVVRRTRDPQRAFRESMAEMIASSVGDVVARPEELERLLACYLSLNADEHHDCIVKVFSQVCLEHADLLLRPPRRRPAIIGVDRL